MMNERAEALIDLPSIIAEADDDRYAQLLSELRSSCLTEEGGRHRLLTVECGSGPEDMTTGRVLANLALLFPYRAAARVPSTERFIRGALDSASVSAHIDATIAELYNVLDPKDLNLACAAASGFLSDLACDVTGRVGTSISVKSLLEAAAIDPRVEELLNWRLPEFEEGARSGYSSEEMAVMEKAADAASNELFERLSALPGDYGRLLRCGAAVNKDQMRQSLVSVGFKPGLLFREMLPEPIDSSFLRGLRGAEDMYVCASAARKALCTNNKTVKDSGYLSRKLVLLVAGHKLDPELADCGTSHGLRFVVQSENHAERLAGRWVSHVAAPEWHMATREQLRELVGHEIALRSPVTCAGEDGCCAACYGELAKSNATIHAGIYGVLVISEQLTQRLLSTKHLLKARPTQITWPEEFLEHFSVERASVIAEDSVGRISIRVEDMDEDEDEERRLASSFTYTVTGKRSSHTVNVPVPIYLDDEAWDDADEDDGVISISPAAETPVFELPVANTDLSEALYAIMRLIEREESSSPEEAYSRLMELLERSEIRTPSVHAEMILRSLVRDPDDLSQRPDYSQTEMPEAVVLKLSPAITSSSSLTNVLAFERIRAQLVSPSVLEKTSPGLLDALFGG